MANLKWLIPPADYAELVGFLEELAIFFSGIGHFLVFLEGALFKQCSYRVESRISSWIPEAARGIGHFKMATFGHLSGIVDKALQMAKF